MSVVAQISQPGHQFNGTVSINRAPTGRNKEEACEKEEKLFYRMSVIEK